jgi:hypothetical protein
VAVQLLLQALHAIAVVGRHFQHRVAQPAVHLQHGVERRGVLVVDQVGLVQQQQRADAGMLGGHQVAVDQVGCGSGAGAKTITIRSTLAATGLSWPWLFGRHSSVLRGIWATITPMPWLPARHTTRRR